MDIIDKKDEDLNKSVELSDQESGEVQVLQEGEMNLKNSFMPDIIQPKIGTNQGLISSPKQTAELFLLEDVRDKVLESQVHEN